MKQTSLPLDQPDKPVLSMLAMRSVLLVCVVLAFAVGVEAQSNQPCAQISVESVEKADPGTPVFFTVRTGNISSSENLTYRWQISVGTITSGQGTCSIAVDTTGLGGQAMHATVDVIGREWTCSVKSKPVEIAAPPPICRCTFDEYGGIRWQDEMARLDNFAIQLTNEPSSRGVLIAFAGNPTYKGETTFRLNRATNYLVNIRDIPREQLLLIDAGYRTDLTTQLWIVREGGSLPALDRYGLLPLSEVRFTKPKPNLNRKSTRRQSN